ncbi:DedA family protein [Paenibacillus sp. XY044]|uniref:DedA family protein n=1 Tax=Paenibacillus sp. XY044 TaxID=2026089 RepID=UPI000B98E9ED|nr:DedA family protein [Paenibacillus sp. XY044]OZB93494.1 hypothetical protein CJP46_21060 [Paenibacillus sp. XY044]
MEWIIHLFEQYGYMVLFGGLFAESLAIPFPGELAMAISGHMSTLGSFHLLQIILYSYIGAILGTTVTYIIGYRMGTPFFEKYGKYVLLNPARIAKITGWFERYGTKLILICYFVPGLRHFTGYVSGVLRINVRTFFLYNYIGGLVWVIVYVMIGRLVGSKIEQFLHLISRYSLAAILVAAVVLGLVVYLKRRKKSSSPRVKAEIRQED